MSFSSTWLELREPADMRARNVEVLQAVTNHFAKNSTLNITDLACGTGSTLFSLQNKFHITPHWTLIDYDADLLKRAKERAAEHALQITTKQVDLNSHLSATLEMKADLITCSAFLDLVSEHWLDQLIAELKRRKLPFYAALTYNGLAHCEPPHEADNAVIKAFNQHQLGDKGFDAAMGPNAAKILIDKCQQAGFEVIYGQADWQFLPVEGIVQAMLIDGWAQAAQETNSLDQDIIEDWRDWRLTRAAAEMSQINVGHVDVFVTLK